MQNKELHWEHLLASTLQMNATGIVCNTYRCIEVGCKTKRRLI